MSLFGSLFNDMEDDPFFGSHVRTMRHMNNMMNSLFADPFGMMGNDYGERALTHRANSHNSLMPFGFPMPNINRLLSGSLDSLGDAHCYSSSTVVSMTSGPDGRPQVYKASSSTRVAPGGIKETQKTVCDSRTGTKKMAIGHHIGERAHIVEREQNYRSGDQEERQEFINLDEEEADDFNKEWETKARARSEIPRLTASGSRSRYNYSGSSHAHSGVPAITASSSRRHRDRHTTNSGIVSPRRSIRSSPLALPPSNTTSTSSSRRPYSPPGQPTVRKNRNIKTVSGSPPPDI
ncbi:Myelodysplasia-myeloid leukemia factor 1-interacting protein [Popillia japonica]|uniref:Myelodysplasia-myeloid leukemia factor 1-interacting protein n=1 Tax=Popillia japonica TaxID=7064 RepID=A0AAW1L6X8_POPJA